MTSKELKEELEILSNAQELKEETNPIKQANILSEILSLKGVK